MVGDGVEPFGADEAVEALDEGVVQHEHDGGEVPGPAPVPEDELTDITNVTDLWVSHGEFPIGY